MHRILALPAVALLALAAGCSTAPSPESRGTPFSLYTHCGVHELQQGGSWFVRDGGPLTDGASNPPLGWDNPQQQGYLTVAGDVATFTDDAGHRETFRRRPGATAPLRTCA